MTTMSGDKYNVEKASEIFETKATMEKKVTDAANELINQLSSVATGKGNFAASLFSEEEGPRTEFSKNGVFVMSIYLSKRGYIQVSDSKQRFSFEHDGLPLDYDKVSEMFKPSKNYSGKMDALGVLAEILHHLAENKR